MFLVLLDRHTVDGQEKLLPGSADLFQGIAFDVTVDQAFASDDLTTGQGGGESFAQGIAIENMDHGEEVVR